MHEIFVTSNIICNTSRQENDLSVNIYVDLCWSGVVFMRGNYSSTNNE